jgi:putative zinc finger protein/uncharacterized protein DUF4367
MTCLNEGIIQAYIDQEIKAPDLDQVEQHFAVCAECRSQLQSASGNSAMVRNSFSTLDSQEASISDPATAYARLQARLDAETVARRSWLSLPFAGPWTPAWGAVAVLAIAILVGFSPARTWAERLLATLRVKRIAVIAIDPESFNRAEQNDPRSYKLLEKTIADSVVITTQPGDPQIVSDPSAAAQLAGFHVRTLNDLSGPQKMQVNGEVAFHMTLDRDRLANVLDEIGRPDIQIPDAVNGATISVHIPKTVFSMYGNCSSSPRGRSRSGENEANQVPSDPSRSNCTLLVQAPSPTVTVPPNLNMSEIAEAGLQLAGMGAGEAHALCSAIDWSSTLVIPVPRDSASSQPVFVDGVEGTLIQMRREENRYSLLWTKNGVIYSLNGNGMMNDALALAASLR